MRLFMEFCQGHPQRLAAAKSGISERTARRIETNRHLPATPVVNRSLRRQGPDPFGGLWDSECQSAWKRDPGSGVRPWRWTDRVI